MGIAETIQILVALEALTRVVVNAGVDFQRLNDIMAQARSEGRNLSPEELNELANAAYTAQQEAYEAVRQAEKAALDADIIATGGEPT